MEVAKILHMNGGVGDSSYANNSLLQKKVILMTKSITNEAISALYHSLFPAETICIADLGCSSGPNAFLAVSELIKTINNECKKNIDQQSPEFHVFLNDLPSNDFNTIFRLSLPEFQENLRKQMGDGFGPNCYVTGVPGSFYGRLFPAKSLHFVHSSYSLQWLSQVSASWNRENNKGNVCIASTSPPNVAKAYYEQYERDFLYFLKYRSYELVKGGGMVLTLLGRRSEDLCNKEGCYIWELLATALNELVAEGLIEEEKVDSFNIPNYAPSPSEIMHVVEKEGSFRIHCLETSEINWEAFDENNGGYNVAKCIRAVAEPLLVIHFGYELMGQVFHKYREIIADCMSKEKPKFINVSVSLTIRN